MVRHNHTAMLNADQTVTITARCQRDKKEYCVTMSEDAYFGWLYGKMTPDHITQFSPRALEFLCTGIMPH